MTIHTLAQFKESFWKRVDKKESGCWEWTGKVNNFGYGQCQFAGRAMQSHRVSYEWTYREIPNGKVIDHICRNRKCVNPSHMEAVTIGENVLRGLSPWAIRKRQTHCTRGHLLDGNNLKIRSNGTRFCRECDKERAQLRRKEVHHE